ncbi:hypothetical protein LTS14_009002 [Recurvomyces mirabilis]|nr:hypothetical protein LTS14_009002 [Recurvomyces mirabilis]
MDPFVTDDTREVQLPSTGPLVGSQVREGQVATQLGQDNLEIGSTQMNDRLVPEARAEVNESAVHTNGSSRRRSSPATRTGFEAGEMSKWAPQTAHDEMRDLLGQPLESAKAKGYLYIFPDVNKQYIKIGFTTGKLWDRFRKIEDSYRWRIYPTSSCFDWRSSCILILRTVIDISTSNQKVDGVHSMSGSRSIPRAPTRQSNIGGIS